ncbi:helix-turn-helix domain-containing protein [Corynebacterium lowii]|nr:helix-turn-helix transcriptional regulator [Corynebacterium lowii]MDP9852300.1 transcriptional regulator with XRE-family HTH domain [Corynebacterium lowii]
MNPAATFGRRLHHARLDRGLSQSHLAAGICSPSAISRWESGQSLPDHEVIALLAERLDIDVSVLTGQGFDSRIAASPEGFGETLHAAFGSPTIDAHSPTARWIARARHVLRHADPWLGTGEPRRIVDDLAVDPLTPTTPAALETVELLEAMVRLRENLSATSAQALTDTLTLAIDAPAAVRMAAIERAVAAFSLSGMPLAARAVIARTAPEQVTLSTAIMLRAAGMEEPPAVAAERSVRDVGMHLITLGLVPVSALESVCPGDELVRLWAEKSIQL